MTSLPIFLQISPPGAGTTGEGEGLETVVTATPPWPAWITLLMVIIAVVFVAVIYLRERSSRGKWVKVASAAIRLALIGLALVMLYELVMRQHRTDLPDLVVLLDDSESMATADRYDDEELTARLARRVNAADFDEATRLDQARPTPLNLAKTLLLEDDAHLLKELKRKYNLKFYLIGPSARPQSTDMEPLRELIAGAEAKQQTSRLGKSVRDALTAQRGRPTAAVIVLSDGITTEGESIGEAAQYARRKKIPLFLVGLGNDKPARDLRVADLLADEVVFVGDIVNFEFKVTGAGYQGRSVEVRLRQKGRPGVLARETIRIGPDGRPQHVRLTHKPDKKGDVEYIVEVAAQDGEADTENNRRKQKVSVKDDTIRVLLVQAYPSYEFRYLKTLLGRQLRASPGSTEKSIELTTVLQDADLEYAGTDETAQRVFPVRRDELFRYDVIVFGDVNPSFLSRSVMNNIADFVKEKGRGIVFIAGPKYTPLAYRDTPLAELIPVDLDSAAMPDPDEPIVDSFIARPTQIGLSSPQMQLGDTPAESARIWSKLPGLYWLLESPEVKPGARVLLKHPYRTNSDGRPLPVVCMQYVGAGKVVFHGTDDTWRWRYRVGDYLFGRYWMQTVRYLSRSKLLGQRRSAEVAADPESCRRGEPVRLRVRFFDDRQAPARDDGVTIVLEREGSKNRRVTLQRVATSRGIFETTLENLAEGDYHAWLATPLLSDEREKDRGLPSCDFVVEARPGEKSNLEMDSADLRLAAERSQGEFSTFDDTNDLLRRLPRGRQVRIEPLPPAPIWNAWYLGVAFVGLIIAEWLLRKWAGML